MSAATSYSSRSSSVQCFTRKPKERREEVHDHPPSITFAVLLHMVKAAERPLCVSQYSLVNYACSTLPYSQLEPRPPYTPSRDDDGGHVQYYEQQQGDGLQQENDHRSHTGGHRHRHRHRHRDMSHKHQSTPAEDNCCKWLKELDDQCVCDLLVRLPPFLSRPAHEYTVVVGEACSISYECPGRMEL